MPGWALAFLVVALVAAALGFGGTARTAAGTAKVLFFGFIVLPDGRTDESTRRSSRRVSHFRPAQQAAVYCRPSAPR